MSTENRSGQRARREIIGSALDRFAIDGFTGTSIQHIADHSGYSKSSVLYHFASKELILDAALTPALDALEAIIGQLPTATAGDSASAELLGRFVDFLLEFRRESAIVLIQGQSLADIPVMQRANELIMQLAAGIASATPDLSMRFRVGVGLAGAAYVLATGDVFLPTADPYPDDDVRAALLGVLSELFFVEH